MSIAALRLNVRKTAGGIAVWEPCPDDESILSTPREQLVFFPQGLTGRQAIAECEAVFARKYPASHPVLRRFRIEHSWRDGNSMIGRVLVLPPEEEFCDRDRMSVDEVCNAAREHGLLSLGCEHGWRGWWSTHELEPYGCYVRYSRVRQRWELVHDPRIIARRHQRHASGRFGRAAARFLTREELWQAADAFAAAVSAYVSEHSGGALAVERRFHRSQSWPALVLDLRNVLTTFNLCFGANAHRRRDVFQKLRIRWKHCAAGTRRRLARRDYVREPQRRDLAAFFDWLDREAKVRRSPKSRKLREQRSVPQLRSLPWVERRAPPGGDDRHLS